MTCDTLFHVQNEIFTSHFCDTHLNTYTCIKRWAASFFAVVQAASLKNIEMKIYQQLHFVSNEIPQQKQNN